MKIVLVVRGRGKRQSGLPEDSPETIAFCFAATIYPGVICVIPSRSAGFIKGLETLLDGLMAMSEGSLSGRHAVRNPNFISHIFD
ncbi:hypothetical protein E1286_27335 [Nonomuraea terrae]|uniref:Uncharacterized protein n=1 Tax=Nonomuraea terrae TaxID=2530383 RepID=A0A4V2YKW2_9ACTN|nr:hypothetical protein [Nonomuraea terrae]TDD44367.1 hypothetical protein E1286_27335 [Nonomuraea terrae]